MIIQKGSALRPPLFLSKIICFSTFTSMKCIGHRWFLCLNLCLYAFLLPGQRLKMPIRHTPRLAVSFGDLPTQRFFPGIVLEPSNGHAGDPVLAAADGYISRISMFHQGGGNQIVIQHPDGKTSYYAHLQRFTSGIQSWIDTIRYFREEEEIDLILDKRKFPVRSGQIIGYMGESGDAASVGLHFEVREEGQVINPARLGIETVDTAVPVWDGLKIYALDDKLLTLDEQSVTVKSSGSTMRLPRETILVNAWRIGIGLVAHDPDVKLHKKGGGINRIELFVDEELVYQYVADKFPIANLKYGAAHMDYPEWIRSGKLFHRCYILPGNYMPAYPVLKKGGIITLSQFEKRKIRIIIQDHSGKKNQIQFYLKRLDDAPPEETRYYQYKIPLGEKYTFATRAFRWTIPSGSLCETTFLQFASAESRDGNMMQYQLHDPATPLLNPMKVEILAPAAIYRDKYVIVSKQGDQLMSWGGKEQKLWISATPALFGTYSLYVDTIPPEILPMPPPGKGRKQSIFQFKVQDDLRYSAHLRPFTWKATINGKWVPVTWSMQHQVLSISVVGHASSRSNTLEISVWDERNNVTTCIHEFSI